MHGFSLYEGIDGSSFFELTENDLQSMKIKMEPRKIILKLIRGKKRKSAYKESALVLKSNKNYIKIDFSLDFFFDRKSLKTSLYKVMDPDQMNTKTDLIILKLVPNLISSKVVVFYL